MWEQIYGQNEIIRFEINNSDCLKYINKIDCRTSILWVIRLITLTINHLILFFKIWHILIRIFVLQKIWFNRITKKTTYTSPWPILRCMNSLNTSIRLVLEIKYILLKALNFKHESTILSETLLEFFTIYGTF